MTMASVLPPTSDTSHALDMPLHHRPKLASSEKNGLGIINENEERKLDNDTVRKQYENMTCDEMSQCMAKNYRQLSEVLGTNIKEDNDSGISTTHLSLEQDASITSGDDFDESFIHRTDLDDATKFTKMTNIFRRAASAGDVEKVTRLLKDKRCRQFIDIDAKDEDGTTPLIYAACFGNVEMAKSLLAGGAKTDVQDSYGWSALMWATNNNHDSVVKILLENGASSQTKSAKGRTVFDFVNTDNQKIVEILATNPRDSFSSTTSILGRASGSISSSTSSNAGDYDFYAQSTLEGYDAFMAEESDRRRKLLETAIALADINLDDEDNDDIDDISSNAGDEENEFHWDKCLPDQMFVFAVDNLNYILDTVITNIHLPVPRQEICIPANVVFLCSRFAHYYSSEELLREVLDGAVQRMSAEIKSNARNVHVLAFWITNVTQLLYYLKKDTGLVTTTADYQLRLSELISEIYSMIVNDTERRMSKVLGPALLEHEEIAGMEDVSFADDWQRYFRRSSQRSVIVPPDGVLAVQMKRNSSMSNANTSFASCTISPQSITSLLSSTLYILHSYEVHPAIIIQALAQFFHYMSCEIFNRILTNKKLLCRSKALQIRMNLSQIEDWIREENLPVSLASYLNPTTQLLQLLQCLTQLSDLASFIHTVKTFDSLNALQVKRCIINYRYEVGEQRLPEEIEKYVMKLAEDTTRYKQTRTHLPVDGSNKGTPMSRAQSTSMRRTRSRRESVSSFVGSLMSSVGLVTSASLPPPVPSVPTEKSNAMKTSEQMDRSPNNESPKRVKNGLTTKEPEKVEKSSTVEKENDTKKHQNTDKEKMKPNEGEEDDSDLREIKDSKFMLPFSVPTTAHMTTIAGWAPEDVKREGRERLVVPIIPGEWMERLDNGSCLG